METTISVHIDVEGNECGLDCPFINLFAVNGGSDEPVPRCDLCGKFLIENEDGIILRCCECLDMERRFHEEARKEAMRKALQEKEGGVRLLEETGYRVDIAAFDTVGEAMKYLVEREKIDPEEICEITGVSREHLEKVIEGVNYPYMLSPFQQTIGIPRPSHITSDEEFARSSKLLHWSDKDE